MILLVPVSHFRVSYETACGRPYSRLDGLVLSAVQEGETTIEALQGTFRVHRRLLTQALVTLIQGGFLALAGGGRGEFLLTHEAEEALQSGSSLETKIVDPSKRASVVMERLTGALASGTELRFIGRRDVSRAWTHAIRLEPQVHHNTLDEAQVRHLLPKAHGEWIQWIGPINLLGKNHQWVPVDADLKRERVVGIPDRWDRRLAPVILEAAGDTDPGKVEPAARLPRDWRTPRRRSAEPDAPRLPDERWGLTVDRADLLATQDDHDAHLRRTLSRAESCVFIGSAFATVAGLERIQNDLAAAAHRGVRVDLLWGYGAEQEALAWLKKFQKDQRLTDNLRFNRSASGSHAKLVIGDVDGVFEAAIGSRNWLSASAPDDHYPRELTIVVRRSGLVSDLCLTAAALWRSASAERLASAIDRWGRIASMLGAREVAHGNPGDEPTNPEDAGASTAALVLDRDHEHLLRAALLDAQTRVLVSSHRIGPAARHRLLTASRREHNSDFSFAVRFGDNVLEETEFAAVEQQVVAAGGAIRQSPTHAKVVVADDCAVVGSYDYLTADPYATARRTRELSIEIRGGACADWIWELMN